MWALRHVVGVFDVHLAGYVPFKPERALLRASARHRAVFTLGRTQLALVRAGHLNGLRETHLTDEAVVVAPLAVLDQVD